MAGKIGATIILGVLGFVVFAGVYSYLHPDDAPFYVLSLPSNSASSDRLSFEQQVEYGKEALQYVNQERTRNGLRTLQWSDSLFVVAIEHSEWMAKTGRFEHSGNQYYNCMGENILMQRGAFITPGQAVQSWMNSPDHRGAIMFPSHFAGAVGIVQNANNDTYYTLIMDSSLC